MSLANNPIRLAIGKFLSKIIIDKPYIFISFWSIIHFIVGACLMFFFVLTKMKRCWRYISLFVLLVLYEVIEYFLIINFPVFWIPETFIDVLFDVVVGMVGGLIVDVIYFLDIKKIHFVRSGYNFPTHRFVRFI